MAFFRFTLPSERLRFPVEMCVYLPDEEGELSVLWLLHGANSECMEWFTQTSLQRYLAGRRLAVITVSVHNGFYVNMQYGAPYADYLEQEWVSSVRRLFPCLPCERSRNFLAGASMGGFGALRLAVNRPGLFSKVGSFAGSIEMPTIVERYQRGIQPGGEDFVWAFGDYENMILNSNDVIYMAQQCVRESRMPQVCLICGTQDFGYALNMMARDDLRLAGADVVWRETEGIHSFDCWDAQLPFFLDWLEEKGVWA